MDSGAIVVQTEEMTVFQAMLTKNRFIEIAAQLSDEYVIFYKYDLADEKPINPPSYHYIIILEEKDNQPPFEYPVEYVRYVRVS